MLYFFFFCFPFKNLYASGDFIYFKTVFPSKHFFKRKFFLKIKPFMYNFEKMAKSMFDHFINIIHEIVR